MNISEFTETAINHPEKRATASRFRLSGRTIWVTVDPKDKNEKKQVLMLLNQEALLVLFLANVLEAGLANERGLIAE